MGARPIVDMTYDFYRAVKSSSSCLVPKCGIRDIQFHHVKPADKRIEVGRVARYGTLEELLAELHKCVPLCDQHHREVHSGYRKGWLVGRFNNGFPTEDDSEARRHMPFKPFFTGLVRNGVLSLPHSM